MQRDRLGRRLASDGSRLSSGGVFAGVTGFIIVIVVVAAIALGAWGCSQYSETRTVRATVEDKERVCESSTNSDGFSSQDCYYLIFTTGGTFKVGDSLLIGRFNSSDVYGRIRRDATYDFEVYGWRFGLTSSYPNIKKATRVSE